MKMKKHDEKARKKKQNIIIFGIISTLVIATIVGMVASRKDYEAFAACLADKGYVMAGTEWCPHCQSQKAMFKGAFEDSIVPAGAYKDCDLQRVYCEENNVQGYPTWITPDGHQVAGVQRLSTLSDMSGCPLK